MCPRTQPAPWDRHAWRSLGWHPCPAALGPTSTTAAMLWSRAGQIFAPVLAQAGFAAGFAAAPVLRRELEATSALPQQQQPETAPGDTEEVDLETKPPDPGHGNTQEAEAHQAASAEKERQISPGHACFGVSTLCRPFVAALIYSGWTKHPGFKDTPRTAECSVL